MDLPHGKWSPFPALTSHLPFTIQQHHSWRKDTSQSMVRDLAENLKESQSDTLPISQMGKLRLGRGWNLPEVIELIHETSS